MSNEYRDIQRRVDHYHRAYIVQKHTTQIPLSEDIFWSLIGSFFTGMAYIIIYPIVFALVNLYKLIIKG